LRFATCELAAGTAQGTGGGPWPMVQPDHDARPWTLSLGLTGKKEGCQLVFGLLASQNRNERYKTAQYSDFWPDIDLPNVLLKWHH